MIDCSNGFLFRNLTLHESGGDHWPCDCSVRSRVYFGTFDFYSHNQFWPYQSKSLRSDFFAFAQFLIRSGRALTNNFDFNSRASAKICRLIFNRMAIATHKLNLFRPAAHAQINFEIHITKRSARFFCLDCLVDCVSAVVTLVFFSCSVQKCWNKNHMVATYTTCLSQNQNIWKSDRLTSSQDCLYSFFCSWVFMDSSAQFRTCAYVSVHAWTKYVWECTRLKSETSVFGMQFTLKRWVRWNKTATTKLHGAQKPEHKRFVSSAVYCIGCMSTSTCNEYAAHEPNGFMTWLWAECFCLHLLEFEMEI